MLRYRPGRAGGIDSTTLLLSQISLDFPTQRQEGGTARARSSESFPLCRFVEFPGYIEIIISRDCQAFPLAGVISQLEGLGEIFPGAS